MGARRGWCRGGEVSGCPEQVIEEDGWARGQVRRGWAGYKGTWRSDFDYIWAHGDLIVM